MKRENRKREQEKGDRRKKTGKREQKVEKRRKSIGERQQKEENREESTGKGHRKKLRMAGGNWEWRRDGIKMYPERKNRCWKHLAIE